MENIEITENAVQNEDMGKLLERIEYDITLEEEDRAFRIFQRLYTLKRNIITSALFGLVALSFAIQIISGKGDSIAWGLMVVCIAFAAVVWLNQYRIRKMLLMALEVLKDDRYILSIYEKGFDIETIIPQEDVQTAREVNGDEDGDEEVMGRLKPPPSRYTFEQDGIRLVENAELYMVFVTKETFHVLPKRTLTESQKDTIKEIFEKKFKDIKKL